MQSKDVLTVSDLQREYGVSKNTAYEFVNQRGFPAIRFGRAIRIPRRAFEAWLAKRFDGNEVPSRATSAAQINSGSI